MFTPPGLTTPPSTPPCSSSIDATTKASVARGAITAMEAEIKRLESEVDIRKRVISNMSEGLVSARRAADNLDRSNKSLREDLRVSGLKNDEQALTITNLHRDLARAGEQIKHTLQQLTEEWATTTPRFALSYNTRGECAYSPAMMAHTYRIVVRPEMFGATFILTGEVASYTDARINANVEDLIKKVADDLRVKLTAEYKLARETARRLQPPRFRRARF